MKATKKVILSLTAVSLLIAEYGTFSQPDTAKAASVPTASKTLTVTAGKKKTITVKGDYIKSKTFKSSETSIATVSKKGVVTAKKAGNCNITVSVKYRKTKNAKKILTKKLTCKVTVKEGKPTSTTNSTQTSVSKNESDVAALKALIAEQKALGATVNEDLDAKEYTWSENGRLIGIYWRDANVQEKLSLQGLPQLQFLQCSGDLTNLDVSSCTALAELWCVGKLTSLNVSSCTALATLWCSGNKLASLDVSKNTALTNLSCNHNQLTSLDVSNCAALTTLECSSNQLTNLDVSKNTALTGLWCTDNQLTSLDVSKNTALTELWCTNNQLTSLDVSKNAALATLDCYSNQLTSLDVSNCTALTVLRCDEEFINVIGKPKSLIN